MSDRELLNLIPFFEALADIDNVYTFLGTANQLPDHAVTTTPDEHSAVTTDQHNTTNIDEQTSADDVNSDTQIDQEEMSTTDDTVPPDYQ